MKLATRFSYKAKAVRSDRPLTDSELMSAVPSIFAEGRHSSRSDKYAFVSTIDIVQALRGEGFFPFFAVQATTRPKADETPEDFEGRRNHTRHMLRLRRAGDINSHEGANEIVLVNSHGSSACSVQALAGFFRHVCQNSLVTGSVQSDIRARHTGVGLLDSVIEGVYSVVDEFGQVEAHMEDMRSLTLSPAQKVAYARGALAMRYGVEDGDGNVDISKSPVRPDQILMPRRSEDAGNSLYEVFNVVEEHFTRGGISGVSADGKRRVRTRPINNIDGSLAMKRGLWELAKSLKEALS